MKDSELIETYFYIKKLENEEKPRPKTDEEAQKELDRQLKFEAAKIKLQPKKKFWESQVFAVLITVLLTQFNEFVKFNQQQEMERMEHKSKEVSQYVGQKAEFDSKSLERLKSIYPELSTKEGKRKLNYYLNVGLITKDQYKQTYPFTFIDSIPRADTTTTEESDE